MSTKYLVEITYIVPVNDKTNHAFLIDTLEDAIYEMEDKLWNKNVSKITITEYKDGKYMDKPCYELIKR